MLSAKFKRNIERIVPFGIIWLVFSLIYTLLEKGILGESEFYPSTGNPYNFRSNILVTPVSAMISGLMIGLIEILYFNKRLSQLSLGKKIILKTLIYLVTITTFLLVLTGIANAITLKKGFFDYEVWQNVGLFFYSYAFMSVGIYMAAIIIVNQFYSEISDNIGHGVLNNFFTGKYHRPKEEERVFMFLDMTSSTTIAESLGHLKYFELLREYYSDLTDSIVDYAGEIYQYVGDEIVVSWKLENTLPNNNCLHCFFALKAALKKQSIKYQDRFNVVPAFKAGFHVGKVTTGEIGVIKKEIIFTGDVLNTTSRIQALCHQYHSEILISGMLIKRLRPEPDFRLLSMGEVVLRGRDGKVELFTISPASSS
jgi:adenylate cyclase